MVTFEIDTRQFVIRLNGNLAKFSRTRFDILQVLYEARGVPVPMAELVKRIYGSQDIGNPENTIRVCMSAINLIARGMTGETLIENVNRQGYYLKYGWTQVPKYLLEARWVHDGVLPLS